MVEAALRTIDGVIEVADGEELLPLIARLRRDGQVVGMDLGPAYKRRVLPVLDGLGPDAEALCSADTVSRRGGALIGWNTERSAFANTLSEAGINPAGRRVLLLGSGSGAAAAADVLKGTAKSIWIAARDPHAAQRLWERLQVSAGGAVALGQLNSVITEVDLVVNAMPVASASPPFSLELLDARQIVFDLVYEPPVSSLVRGARAHGARAVNGLGMLLQRGMASYEIWTGEAAPEREMRAALERVALEQMSR